MATIDTYFEWLLEQHKSGDTIVVVQEETSEEEYLKRLDILISELFSKVTAYSEEEYRSGKALLMLLKKYCFSKKTYGNAPLSASFAAYSDATQKMIDEELQKFTSAEGAGAAVVDASKVFTIVSNTLQLLTSVVRHFSKAKEERVVKSNARVVGIELAMFKVDVQKEIVWERENTALMDPVPYLDGAFTISDDFEKARKNENSPRRMISDWAEFKYLKMALELTMEKLRELEVF